MRQQNKYPNLDFLTGQYHKFINRDISQIITQFLKDGENSEACKDQRFYKTLEYDHAYIQWIFPNFFNSMFNSDSYRLTFEERDLIIQNEKAINQYLQTFYMFMKFLGMNKQLELVDRNQFHKCLFVNVHNQMRIKRILASLSVLGQRELALKLLDKLQQYIEQFESNKQAKNIEKNSKKYKLNQYKYNYSVFQQFEDYGEVHEENPKVQATFNDRNNLYLQSDLLNKPEASYKLITKEYVYQNSSIPGKGVDKIISFSTPHQQQQQNNNQKQQTQIENNNDQGQDNQKQETKEQTQIENEPQKMDIDQRKQQ